MIRAGTIHELHRQSGDWLFIDVGFARSARSCGLLFGDGEPMELTFSDLRKRSRDIISESANPLNLLIEAPLSVAFTVEGNPTGRSVEKRGSVTRYWYVGLGCGVLVAALHYLGGVADLASRRDIRLFEGFASFKKKGSKSSHSSDVLKLREVVWHPDGHPGAIVSPDRLALGTTDVLSSAFKVAGQEFGVPPVVVV